MAYDAANQPTSYTISGTTTAITYDTQGNRLTGPAPGGSPASYTWDQANRLTAANGTTYSYNADGIRTTRTPATGPAQHYAWDTRAGVPLMLTDGTTNYLYDDVGNPIEQIDSTGAALYYQHDQYGSTRILTDQTGSAAASYTYDANGNLTTKTGTADTPLRWNGQTQDTDTGLYYLRARYYDPATTQFLSVDPLAAITQAIYTYASNNPLNLLDPLGLWDDSDTQSLFGVILGGLGVVVGVAAVVVAAPEIALGLAGGAFALGVGAVFLDGPGCLGKGEMLACAGFALGSASSIFGGGSFLAAAAGSETLAGGLGIFGAEVGAGGFGLDLFGLVKHARGDLSSAPIGKDQCVA